MSRRRKHVTLGLRDEVEVAEGQAVARVQGARGGNQIEVELPSGRRTLVLMPAKFMNKLWVRRGGYVVVEEGDAGTNAKVSGTITTVLYDDHVKQLKKQGTWPPEFESHGNQPSSSCTNSNGSDDGASGTAERLAQTSPEGGGSGRGAAAATTAAPQGEACVDGEPPAGSSQRHTREAEGEDDDDDDDESDLPPLFENTNRRVIYHEPEDCSGSDSD